MKKRQHSDIPVNINVLYGSENYYCGTVTRLSEKDMFISLDQICFPVNLNFEIIFPCGEDFLKIPARIKQLRKTEDYFNGLHVDVIDPPEEYIKFTEKCRSSMFDLSASCETAEAAV